MNAITDVLAERARQDAKWGEQNHDPIMYGAILMEEVGEMMQAALECKFGGPHGTPEHLREEAVQVAAVALAIVECLDRSGAGRRWRNDKRGIASSNRKGEGVVRRKHRYGRKRATA